MNNVGIVGCGFVGRSIYNGLSSSFKMFIYDKYKEGFNTLKEVLENCNVIFICVPTPMNEDGSQDLSNMEDALKDISETSNTEKVLVLKSTILPGTTRYFSEKYPQFDFVFNPEFLTERNAEFDFINQTRIILGVKRLTAYVIEVKYIYETRFPNVPIHICEFEEAELTKYICNCFFAVKISFFNEVFELCSKIGVNYEDVRRLFLGDFRIANSHTEVPGPDNFKGFGGKCFPKDLNSFINWGSSLGLNMNMFKSAEIVNERVRDYKDWNHIVGATSNNNYRKE